MRVFVSTHARTHVCMHLVRLSEGFDISKGMVKLFGPTPPPNPIPFAWNLRFLASLNISSSRTDRAPRKASLCIRHLDRLDLPIFTHLRERRKTSCLYFMIQVAQQLYERSIN